MEKVKAVDLAKALRQLLENDSFRQNAQQASISMQNQAGVSKAVELIYSCLSALS